MGRIIDKIKISTGRDSSNNFDLSCFHATTASFFVPRITYMHEFVPDEKWNMDARCSVRCLPMVKPTIADIKVHNRFFFVPFYSICNDWNNFLSESPVPGTAGVLSTAKIPNCYEQDIVNLFVVPTYNNRWAQEYTGSGVSDFTNNGKKYNFTPLGMTLNAILNGLGIVLNFKLTGSNKGNHINCLSIFAYLKIYLDWYNNTTFDTRRNLERFFNLFDTGNIITTPQLDEIFQAVTHMYLEKDYFTAATLYPVGTNSSTMQTNHSLPDITETRINVLSSVDSSNHGTPIINQTANTNTAVASKYSLDAVQLLTDYVKRHQLAGIQPFNRILAEYGVTLDDEVLKRSTFIGDVVEDIDIKTVLNLSYADDTKLGERAGIADGGHKKNLSFHNKNFGIIICVTTVVPRASYTDGIKRTNLRTERFDFFTPTMEHLGVEPLYVAELFNRFKGTETPSPTTGQIFGYLPRYASYKTSLDSVSGDFVNRRSYLLKPWLLTREFPTISTTLSDVATISENFITADQSKFNNLFENNSVDNFIIFNMYHVNSRLPMHKLFDDYQWSNEGDNPQHVTIPNQGVQLT